MKFLYKGVKVSQLQRSFNKFLTRPILWSVYKSFIESSKPICGCFIELSSVKHVWVLILTLGLFFFLLLLCFWKKITYTYCLIMHLLNTIYKFFFLSLFLIYFCSRVWKLKLGHSCSHLKLVNRYASGVNKSSSQWPFSLELCQLRCY